MSQVASALADPSRVTMLCALMDGRAWTATELAVLADIAASTASGHLARLLNSRLVICLSQGRHRYYRLAGQHVAGLLENLMGVSMHAAIPPATRTPAHLRYARTCYDHLAGELAVEMYAFMLQQGWLESDGSALTADGKHQFAQMGVLLNPAARRKSCCACLDWSERRFHLGGEAGSAMMTFFISKAWMTRVTGYREVQVTARGRKALKRIFNLSVA